MVEYFKNGNPKLTEAERKERHSKSSAKWEKENSEKVKLNKANWRKENSEKVKVNNAKHRYSHGGQSMSENKASPVYLGVHIAESFLAKVFENVNKMPYGHQGYDFICSKGHTIDVKSSCLRSNNDILNKSWQFKINKNITAEYFLLLAFDNRNDLNPQHIWLVPGNIVNDHHSICITNAKTPLSKWSLYEQSDRLDKLIACCNTVKGV